MFAIAAERHPGTIGERAVVLDQPLQRFPGQVQAVECGIAALQRGDDAQRLRIMVEAAERGEAGVERTLAGMAERRMAEIMGQRQRLGEILVETEPPRERAGDLCHFEGVSEPGAVMVAFVEYEDLRLVLEAAECGGVDDTVAVAAEDATAFAGRLGMEPAPAQGRIAGVRRSGYGSFHRFEEPRRAFGQLTLAVAALNYRYSGCNRRDFLKQSRYFDGRAENTGDEMMSANVVVTERAAQKIGEILGREPAGTMLRVSVEGGGCSGFQYKFDTEKSRADDDIMIEKNGATVLIDPVSLDYMAGSEIDFVDDLIGQSFKINNPKATASCGCGTSFAL